MHLKERHNTNFIELKVYTLNHFMFLYQQSIEKPVDLTICEKIELLFPRDIKENVTKIWKIP